MSTFAANMPSDPEATCVASRDTGKQLYVLGEDKKTFDAGLSGERKSTGKVREGNPAFWFIHSQPPHSARSYGATRAQTFSAASGSSRTWPVVV